MSQYVDKSILKMYGCMPAEDIDALDTQYPGLIDQLAKGVSGHFDSMLAKRYGAPFQTPYPDVLVYNVAQVVNGRLYLKRGFNPSSEQDKLIKGAHDDALKWLREAADPEKGLVELPLKQQALGASAVTVGSPLAYSEASPYAWTDQQAQACGGRR